jgi:hypothetical protein
MKKHINDAENNKHLDQWKDGLKRQEFHSFYTEGGSLRKETIVRVYYTLGGYTDTTSTETICNAS